MTKKAATITLHSLAHEICKQHSLAEEGVAAMKRKLLEPDVQAALMEQIIDFVASHIIYDVRHVRSTTIKHHSATASSRDLSAMEDGDKLFASPLEIAVAGTHIGDLLGEQIPEVMTTVHEEMMGSQKVLMFLDAIKASVPPKAKVRNRVKPERATKLWENIVKTIQKQEKKRT